MHTPGPWTAHPKLIDGCRIRSGRTVIAEAWGIRTEDGEDSPETAANIRLIEAAPDLLSALHIAAAHIDRDNAPIHNIISAAIAKARG